MSRTTRRTTAIAALAAAAIAAPSAVAQPIDPGVAAHAESTSQPQAVTTRTVEIRANGFDWADAGLGAAGMLCLLGLGAGVAVAGASRSRARPRVGPR
jgi:hypothetical protein